MDINQFKTGLRAAEFTRVKFGSGNLEEEAWRVGHPDPANATWGEINVLSVAQGIAALKGRTPIPRNVAEQMLHIAAFETDFNA